MSQRNRQIKQGGTANEIVTVMCRIELPEHVFQAYEEEGQKRGRDAEEIMVERLNRCKGITGSGIYFSEEQKARLCRVLAKTVSDAEGALQRLETAQVIDVNGYSVSLDPRVLERLRTRVFRSENFHDVLWREIARGLMTYCGMNPPQSNSGGWWKRHIPKTAQNGKEPQNGKAANVI